MRRLASNPDNRFIAGKVYLFRSQVRRDLQVLETQREVAACVCNLPF